MHARQLRRKAIQRNRSLRGFRPALEACEARTLLTAGAFLQGTAFIDTNNNAVFDVGEAALPGATIKLYDATGATLLGQTTTDASGNYLFEDGNGTVFSNNLTPGTYKLVEIPPTAGPSYTVTGTQALWQIGPVPTVGPGVSTATVTIPDPSKTYVKVQNFNPVTVADFVLAPLGTGDHFGPVGTINVTVGTTPSAPTDLSGVFGTYCVAPTRDIDTDLPYHMIPTTASAVLGPNAGRIAYLYNHYKDAASADSSGVSAGALQVAITELEEDITPDLTSGNYYLLSPSTPAAVVAKANFYLNDSAGKNEVVMVLDATLGGTVYLPAQSLLATDSVNFANQPAKVPTFQNISISGMKYNDLNGDGNAAGDSGLGGVTIELFKDGGTTPIATTVTGPNGVYSFADLGAGTYTVKEEVPSGWTQTLGNPGYTVVAQSGVNSTGNDFADFQNISIGGTKYNDANGDGSTVGDAGLTGVTIDLFKNGGTTPVATTVTGSNGSYSFTNLGPGSYTVKEEVPSGWTQTLGTAGYTIVAQSGVNSSGDDFANFQNISISGAKYNDLNGDGNTAGDTGLGGVTIDLFKDGGTTPIATTVTGSNGAYSFTNLGPGTYTVKEEVPSGWTQTLGAGGYTVAAQSGQNVGNENFANFQLISISGTKYNDLSGDSSTAGDPGVSGVTIDLFKNGATTPVATTVTGSNGAYSFTNLGPGSYTVKEEVPSGWTQTLGSAGYTVAAQSGSNSSGDDFANFQLISISGTKYNDANGDGSTVGDVGVGGVTIDLFKNGGTTPIATTVTGSNGSYDFTNLGPGSYTVKEEVPSGWSQTLGSAGYTVAAQSGVNSGGDDFANFQLISISGTKYNDANGDGSTVGDAGLTGVTIDLFKNGGTTPVATTVTGSNGAYSFTNLGPGSYTVKEEVPAGWTQTLGSAGYTVAAQSGVNSSGDDFSNFQLISISGTKYNDLNGDGNTSGDAGLTGVAIDLFKNGGTTPIATTVTGSNGAYSFTNLGPGIYTVKEEVPAGWTQTLGSTGYTIAAQSGTNSSGNDFANFQLISISGVKYNDLNGDGSTSGDPVLGGVTIDLFKNGGTTPVATTVTGSNGAYSFTNLGPGSYTVKEETPASWTQTLGTAGYAVIAQSGTNSSGNDFANFQLISISGIKYNDLNGDGNTAGDSGLGGVTIDLFKNGGTTPVASTITAANGSYSFTNLGPGSYTVKEEVPAGWTQTLGMSGYTVAAQSGQNVGNENFANFQNVSISGVKYNDLNGNGNTTGDPGLAGVTIDLFKNGGTTPVATTVTGSNGAYSFTNLGPGSYTVKEEVPSGSTQTLGIAGYTITAQSGTNSSGNDFANFQLISISGTKYNDLNGDGSTAGDAALAGVAIDLFKNGGTTPIATTVTGSNGAYSFTNLGPGSYTVKEEVPAGWTQTLGMSGYTVAAQSGQNVGNENFANFQNVSILGVKYNDLNGNGNTTGDPGLAGVTIDLFKNGGTTPVATTVTGSNGSYSFTNLGPGTYTVKEEVPSGWLQTVGSAGYTITAQSGTNSSGNNFANFQLISISGTKYNDLNGDGSTVGDSGLGGVTMKLFKNGGTSAVATTTTASNGTYSFTNLGPGSYTVQEAVPTGWIQTLGGPGSNGSYTVTAQSGQNVTSDNFADFQLICISGIKFKDLNANSQLDSGEPGLSGVTINLFKNGGSTPVASTTTGSNGSYSFTNLGPGTYSVQEVVPAGWGQTLGGAGPNGSYVIVAQSGQNVGNQNFGDVPIQTCACNLSGVTYSVTSPGGTTTVVNDLRGHTQQGSTVSVTFVVPAGQYDQLSLVSYNAVESFFSSSTASLQTVYQSVTGIYGPGSHTISVSLPNNFYQVDFVCGTVITQLGTDSNAFYSAQNRLISADNGGINPIGQSPISVSGVVFCDQNNNGIQSSEDDGLGGVTVTLTGTDAYGISITATATSDAQGHYTIVGVPPSNSAGYKVTVSPPAGNYSGKAKVGSAGGTLMTSTEGVSGIVLGSGTNSGTNYNFGILMPSSLSGLVYVDAHNDAQVQLDDLGLPGITVKLTGTDSQGNAVSQTTLTDDSGEYLFTGLLPGTYTITVVQPSGISATQAAVGTVNGATDGQVKSCSSIGSIILNGWCAEGSNYNFGEQGSAVCHGQTAATTFWYSQRGQTLIKSFDGGSTSKDLGNWLAAAMPNMLGSLQGQTNTQVASYFMGLCNNANLKANAQAMATALAVYATDSSLGGNVASQYGFTVTTTGVATSTYNVGSNGAALGLLNNTSYCVLLLLEQVDVLTTNGVIASSASNAVTTVFTAINKVGGVS